MTEEQALLIATKALERIDAHQAQCTERWGHLHEEMTSMRGDVRSMKSALDQGKGGWKATVFLAGISATIGAAAMKLLPFGK